MFSKLAAVALMADQVNASIGLFWCPDAPPSMDYFSLKSFSGTWYEIYRDDDTLLQPDHKCVRHDLAQNSKTDDTDDMTLTMEYMTKENQLLDKMLELTFQAADSTKKRKGKGKSSKYDSYTG